MSVEEAHSGDIVVVAGIADISIGETLCDPKDHVMPMESIEIEEPTLSMNFHGQQERRLQDRAANMSLPAT